MAEAPDAPEAPQETVAPPEAVTNGSEPPAEQPKPARSVEDLEAELAKTRREAANYRVKLKEVEPIAKKAQEAAEAEKTEVQRANDRAQEAEKREKETLEGYQRLELAVQYHIEPEDIDLIGAGTREEMDARAQRVAALNAAAKKATPPPTDQPVEGLRPGASPSPARGPDDSYPEEWKPAYMRDNEKRSFHGQ
jgi:chromosome segregation ATPase